MDSEWVLHWKRYELCIHRQTQRYQNCVQRLLRKKKSNSSIETRRATYFIRQSCLTKCWWNRPVHLWNACQLYARHLNCFDWLDWVRSEAEPAQIWHRRLTFTSHHWSSYQRTQRRAERTYDKLSHEKNNEYTIRWGELCSLCDVLWWTGLFANRCYRVSSPRSWPIDRPHQCQLRTFDVSWSNNIYLFLPWFGQVVSREETTNALRRLHDRIVDVTWDGEVYDEVVVS